MQWSFHAVFPRCGKIYPNLPIRLLKAGTVATRHVYCGTSERAPSFLAAPVPPLSALFEDDAHNMQAGEAHPSSRLSTGSDATALSRAEAWLIVAATFLYWNDILRQIFPGIESTSIEFRLVHFFFYGAFALGVVGMGSRVLDDLHHVPLLLVTLALPVVSALWSISPIETIQRSIAVMGSSLFGIYLACRLPPLDAFRLIGIAATLSAAVGVLLITFFPSIGLMSEGEYVNVWAGAHLHKNGLGQMTALGAMICLVVLLADGVRRNPLLTAGFLLNLALLVGSRSLTSQLVFAIGILLLFTVGRFLRLLVANAAVTIPVGVLLLVLAAFGLGQFHFVDVLNAAGKDATMSSRVPLWQLLFSFMESHWWLGHGYEVFWSDDSYAVRVIEGKLHFRPYYAHNGYLEIWLAFGALGLALIAVLIASLAVRTLRGLYLDGNDPLLLLSFVYLLMFLLQNAAEATILQRNVMSWTLFVMLYISVTNTLRNAQASSIAPPARARRLLTEKEPGPVQRLPVE